MHVKPLFVNNVGREGGGGEGASVGNLTSNA